MKKLILTGMLLCSVTFAQEPNPTSEETVKEEAATPKEEAATPKETDNQGVAQQEEAKQQAAKQNRLQNGLKFHLWFPNLEGKVAAKGVKQNVDFDYDDMEDASGIGAGYVYWGDQFGFEAVLGASSQTWEPSGKKTHKVEIDKAMLGVGVLGHIAKFELAKDLMLGLDGVVGGRVVSLDMKVTKYDPKIKGDDDYTWAEPYVGATVSLSYAKKYALFTRCDYGGFGIGSAPEHVYNLTFGASYRATKRISIDAGYKIYDIDYKRGSGDDRFIYDIRQEGIFAGFTFYF